MNLMRSPKKVLGTEWLKQLSLSIARGGVSEVTSFWALQGKTCPMPLSASGICWHYLACGVHHSSLYLHLHLEDVSLCVQIFLFKDISQIV